MSYECCQSFPDFSSTRILVDIIAGKNFIALPIVDMDELLRRVIRQTQFIYCSCGFDAWVSSMLDVTACDCSTLVELTPSQRLEEGHLGHAKIHVDVAIWASPKIRSASRRRRYLFLKSILIKTTYDSDLIDELDRSWCVHESNQQVQNLGDHGDSAYSLHDALFRSVVQQRQNLYLCRLMFAFLLVITQSISRCLNIHLKWFVPTYSHPRASIFDTIAPSFSQWISPRLKKIDQNLLVAPWILSWFAELIDRAK